MAFEGIAARHGRTDCNFVATALQLHERAVVCLDEGAASKLRRNDYAKWVFVNKPSRQRIP